MRRDVSWLISTAHCFCCKSNPRLRLTFAQRKLIDLANSCAGKDFSCCQGDEKANSETCLALWTLLLLVTERTLYVIFTWFFSTLLLLLLLLLSFTFSENKLTLDCKHICTAVWFQSFTRKVGASHTHTGEEEEEEEAVDYFLSLQEPVTKVTDVTDCGSFCHQRGNRTFFHSLEAKLICYLLGFFALISFDHVYRPLFEVFS